MDLYNTVKFVHILAAILLVGFSFYMEFVLIGQAKRAATVETLRGWVRLIALTSRSLNIFAAITFIAGLYMAFAGDWWSQGWVVVALVMFLAAGAIAGGVLDPASRKAVEYVDGLADGPVTPEIGTNLSAPNVELASKALAGVDVAILFLMVTKPGYPGSAAVAVTGVCLGLAIGLWERRNAVRTTAPAAPST